MATVRGSIYKDELGGDIRYRLVLSYHTHRCRIKVWNRRNLNIRPQVVILPYIGALVKLVHIIKKSCLACMFDTLRDLQICLSTPIYIININNSQRLLLLHIPALPYYQIRWPLRKQSASSFLTIQIALYSCVAIGPPRFGGRYNLCCVLGSNIYLLNI